MNGKQMMLVGLALVIGLAAGYFGKTIMDKNTTGFTSNSLAYNSSASNQTKAPLLWTIHNEMLAPFLWRVSLDPFWTPTVSPMAYSTLDSVQKFPDAYPKIQASQDNKTVNVTVQLPGMTLKDLDIKVSQDIVSIAGHKAQEDKNKSSKNFSALSESFEETVRLPCKVDGDKAKAAVQNGLLTISVPKLNQGVATKPDSHSWQ